MNKVLDIAHLAFLELIRDSIRTTGGAAAKGMLIRKSLAIADEIPEVEYPDLAAWDAAVQKLEHPIALIEGQTIREGNIFGLPACPFAPSINSYKQVFSSLPGEYPELVAEYNKPSAITDKLKIGGGAGVSPFCAIHQPLRSGIGKRIRVGGKSVQIVQLGCKAGDGQRGLAMALIEELGVDRALVEKMLETNMCVYAVRIEETS